MKFFSNEIFSSSKNTKVLYDIYAFFIICSIIVILCLQYEEVDGDLIELSSNPITLEYYKLFEYSMRTSSRMFVAIIISVIFAIIYGLIAAKNKRMEMILIPMLDVLQSVPVLGFISFTVTGFLAMFPGKIIGAEIAVVFAIFTSQAWNIAFSAYSSFKHLPRDLVDLAKLMKLSAWTKFWNLELPFAAPGIIWNVIISMAGGWFFIVASEVIVVGNKSITLDGIGSYIALSLIKQDTSATIMAIVAMSCVIIIYDQLIMRPLVVWADKFRYDSSMDNTKSISWALNIYSRSRILSAVALLWRRAISRIVLCKMPSFFCASNIITNSAHKTLPSKYINPLYQCLNILINILVAISTIYALIQLFVFIDQKVDSPELFYVIFLAFVTWFKIMILIIIASIIWVPIGVLIGLNPKMAEFVQPFTQFLASFPINLLFPFMYILITHYNLNPEIWMSPLIIIGTQWYILFNVVAAANALPNELIDLTKILKIRGVTWWKQFIIPAILPHYVTGAITACGASWNASIVAEVLYYGNNRMSTTGIGTYINDMTSQGDLPRIALGISVMAFFVVVFNRIFWQPIYDWTSQKYQI